MELSGTQKVHYTHSFIQNLNVLKRRMSEVILSLKNFVVVAADARRCKVNILLFVQRFIWEVGYWL